MKYIIVGILSILIAAFAFYRIQMYSVTNTKLLSNNIFKAEDAVYTLKSPESQDIVSVSVEVDSVYNIMIFEQISSLDTSYYIILDNITSIPATIKDFSLKDVAMLRQSYILSRAANTRIDYLKDDLNKSSHGRSTINVVNLSNVPSSKLLFNKNIVIFFCLLAVFAFGYYIKINLLSR